MYHEKSSPLKILAQMLLPTLQHCCCCLGLQLLACGYLAWRLTEMLWSCPAGCALPLHPA